MGILGILLLLLGIYLVVTHSVVIGVIIIILAVVLGGYGFGHSRL